jgi:hypothetical protein
MTLRTVLSAVAAVHGAIAAEPITFANPGGSAEKFTAIVYAEKRSWRQNDRGREQVTLRDVIVPDRVVVGARVTITDPDGSTIGYTVEAIKIAASGRRRATCRRTTSVEITRPNYRGNP